MYYTDMMYIIRTLQYARVFACILTYNDSISVQLRAYTYGHGAVTVASRSPASAPAPVSALSLRGRYGKFVARHRKRRQAGRPIQSDQVCATEQRKPAASCTGAPQLHAEVPCNLGNNGAVTSR
jgi:hypothetical protein